MNNAEPSSSTNNNKNERKITKNQLKIKKYIEKIGEGATGKVYIARDSSNRVVAVKRSFRSVDWSKEVEILKSLKHPNVVELYFCYYEDHKKVKIEHMVMEYFPKNLYQVRSEYLPDQIPIPEIKLLLFQLFRSVGYLHNNQITHRDLKPENVLVDMATGVLKICDFGLATDLTKRSENHFYVCTREYRAPELLLKSKSYSEKIDIWSLGCISAELFTGKSFFHRRVSENAMENIIYVLGSPTKREITEMVPLKPNIFIPKSKPALSFRKNFPCEMTVGNLNFIKSLLCYSPTGRPSAHEAMAGEFFDDLRKNQYKLKNSKPFPDVFSFILKELPEDLALYRKIMPTLASLSKGLKAKQTQFC